MKADALKNTRVESSTGSFRGNFPANCNILHFRGRRLTSVFPRALVTFHDSNGSFIEFFKGDSAPSLAGRRLLESDLQSVDPPGDVRELLQLYGVGTRNFTSSTPTPSLCTLDSTLTYSQ